MNKLLNPREHTEALQQEHFGVDKALETYFTIEEQNGIHVTSEPTFKSWILRKPC